MLSKCVTRHAATVAKRKKERKKGKETNEEKFVRKLVYQRAKLPLTTDSPTPTPTLAAHFV